MTTFIIVGIFLYVYLATIVAEAARDSGRNPRKWFFTALAINPLIAYAFMYFGALEATDA